MMINKLNKPFSMIREFHLADWFTLANAVCGTGALFSMMTYLQTTDVRHVYFACGMVVARKGWLTKADVMNCLPLGKIENELGRKRGR